MFIYYRYITHCYKIPATIFLPSPPLSSVLSLPLLSSPCPLSFSLLFRSYAVSVCSATVPRRAYVYVYSGGEHGGHRQALCHRPGDLTAEPPYSALRIASSVHRAVQLLLIAAPPLRVARAMRMVAGVSQGRGVGGVLRHRMNFRSRW